MTLSRVTEGELCLWGSALPGVSQPVVRVCVLMQTAEEHNQLEIIQVFLRWWDNFLGIFTP